MPTRKLRVVYGPSATLDLGDDPVAIGRERATGLPTLVVRDPEVSRRHATVTYDRAEDTYCLLDAGSKNGTRVDGSIRRHAPLRHGSVIRAGRTVILYTEGDSLPPALEDVAAPRALTADVAEAILLLRRLQRQRKAG